jgi:acyl-CoA synthetase (AMP-forming)/AMP-acid ligase II
MRLEQRLDEISREYGSRTALTIVDGDAITFGGLVARSREVSSALISLGVTPGDRVALVSPHDIEALVAFWGILRAGGVVVWLNDDAKTADFPGVVRDADPRLILLKSERSRALFGELREFNQRIRTLEELAACAPDGQFEPPGSLDEGQPAIIIYTSGSSGRPKGVCLSHRNLAVVALAVIEHMPITADDSYLMVVPMHYVHGIMQLLVHAFAGASVFFLPSFVFPKKVVDAIRTTRVSGFSGVPFHFAAITARGGFLEAELPDLRWVTVTGGKLSANAIMQILDRFPSLRFHIAYGQTECAPRATALDPAKTPAKPESVGSPIPGVEVLLLDEAGQPVPQGEPGEVVVKGENVMLGYWNDSDATAAVIDDEGRLHTGDIGRFDSDGDLYLVGRRSAMIKSAGERIVPEEIERILVAHPAVEDAVVVGVEDPMLGQRVVAHIQPGKDQDTGPLVAEVRDYCLSRLPLSRAPQDFILWASFPRTANGKPDRVRIAHGPVDG